MDEVTTVLFVTIGVYTLVSVLIYVVGMKQILLKPKFVLLTIGAIGLLILYVITK
jgi:hypothetical protein